MSKRIILLAAFGVAFFAGSASAAQWSYEGVISECNEAICNLVPVFAGDPVVGEITIDVGANDAFTLDDTFMDFSFLVGGAIPVEFPGGDPVQGVYITGSGTTGPDGDFASGLLNGEFIGGTLGPLLATVEICLAGSCLVQEGNTTERTLGPGGMLVTVGSGTVFVVEVVSNDGFVMVVDTDGDGVADDTDNCTNVANADQRDTDGDSIGNICDTDVDGLASCITNFTDLNVYRSNFFQPGDLDTDNNGDNSTNFVDLNIVRTFFFQPPGPSAAGCN